MEIYVEYLIQITVFLFGLIIGSFLNVYILRLNTGKDTKGRSACDACGHKLSALELIPLLSYLFLKGRCKVCQTRIYAQHPIVELTTAVLFLIIYHFIKSPALIILILYFILASLSVVITVYDFKHKLIDPKVLLYFYITVSGIFLYKTYIYDWYLNYGYYLSTVISVILFAGPIFLLWFLSSGKAMGFGDVKLAPALALLMSPQQAFLALGTAFVSGALTGLIVIFISKLNFIASRYTLKTELAFAPFLLLGFWFSVLSGLGIYDIINAW